MTSFPDLLSLSLSLVLLLGACAPAPAPAPSELPTLHVGPALDFEVSGSGSDPAWARAPCTPLRKRQPDGLPYEARFKLLGGIDNDPAACVDFEYLTGTSELQADIHELTAEQLVAYAGVKAPDVVFLSPPCKGSSALLSAAKAKETKYRKLNRLALSWTKVCSRRGPTLPLATYLSGSTVHSGALSTAPSRWSSASVMAVPTEPRSPVTTLMAGR